MKSPAVGCGRALETSPPILPLCMLKSQSGRRTAFSRLHPSIAEPDSPVLRPSRLHRQASRRLCPHRCAAKAVHFYDTTASLALNRTHTMRSVLLSHSSSSCLSASHAIAQPSSRQAGSASSSNSCSGGRHHACFQRGRACAAHGSLSQRPSCTNATARYPRLAPHPQHILSSPLPTPTMQLATLSLQGARSP